MYPLTPQTSEFERILMFAFWLTSVIFGVTIQEAQSNVGNVLSSIAIFPPMVTFFSTMSTGKPASAMSRAAVIPAIPPPMTKALFVIAVSPGVRGVSSIVFAMAAFPSAMDFSVALGMSFMTQEHCSRMFATSTLYGLSPARSAHALNVFSCILGEHEQRTTPVRSSSLILSSIIF